MILFGYHGMGYLEILLHFWFLGSLLDNSEDKPVIWMVVLTVKQNGGNAWQHYPRDLYIVDRRHHAHRMMLQTCTAHPGTLNLPVDHQIATTHAYSIIFEKVSPSRSDSHHTHGFHHGYNHPMLPMNLPFAWRQCWSRFTLSPQDGTWWKHREDANLHHKMACLSLTSYSSEYLSQ